MSLHDSDISKNVPFTFRNKQPIHLSHVQHRVPGIQRMFPLRFVINNQYTCRMFSTEFQVTDRYQGFPTKTVCYNNLHPVRENSNVVVTSYSRPISTAQSISPLHDEHAAQHILYSNDISNTTCFLFPQEGFVNMLSQLCFNPNDCIINLMPIAMYCDYE